METMEKEQLANTIGQNIARLRKKNGLTQAELAEKLGVNAAHISRVECGKRMLSPQKIQMVADLFRVSCDVLYHVQKETDPSIQNIMILLENRPKIYIDFVEHILRFSPELPVDR